ncbi:fizzy-related protein homolog [Cherax quadricarinatus]
MDREYERRLLRQQNGPVTSPASPLSPRRQVTVVSIQSPSKERTGDRFIPTRAGANWDVNFALIQENNKVNSEVRKGREGGEGKDGVAYTTLLRNELLGTNIDDLRDTQDDRRALSPVHTPNLYHFSPRKNHQREDALSPYSLSPVSAKSQKLLRSPRKAARKISKIPFKVLDAPELQDDFYLNLVDWSSQNVLSVGLGHCVYLWSAYTSQVTRLCDLSLDGDSVTSVSWSERVSSSLTSKLIYCCHLSVIHMLTAIAWSPHHHGLLASGGGTADRCIRFWNTLTGQPMQCVDTGSQVCNLAWSKHASELVSTHGYSQNQILVWRYPSLAQVAKLTGHTYRVLYLAMSPDGEAIVTGAGDETLRFWNVFSKARSQKESKSVLNLFTSLR